MQHLIKDITSFIKSKPPHFFQFKVIRGEFTGFFKGDHIELDYKKDLVQSVVHECLHALNPKLSETKIIKLEKQVFREITNLQVACILLELSKKIKYNEIHQSFYKRS